jgi:hypothetical protein
MSTHCAIAIKSGETYLTIYCHHDGCPSRMFPILQENYNSLELANKLVSFGDASSIKKKLEPTPYSGHKFGAPEPDVSVFYHRDRGEDWHSCQPACYTKNELLRQDFGYIYVFEDGTGWKRMR